MENVLFLNDFISQYKDNKEKNNTSLSVELNYTVFEVRLDNKYKSIEKLYVNMDTDLPEKLEVQDYNKNTVIYILYTEIKLNNLS